MSARRAAQRHHAEVGDVLAVHSDGPGPLVKLGFVLVWLLFSGLTFINPGETVVLAVAPTVAFALIFGLILLYNGGERLIVCERGLLVGSVAPGLRPYVVRFDQIVPGTLAPLEGAQRYASETGNASRAESTVRRSAWTRRGIHFVGPSPKEARRHRARFAPFQDPPPRGVNEQWVWFAGTGATPPEHVTGQIAEAARAAGFQRLAEATASARVRELSGNPPDAPHHLPGFRASRA